MVVDGGEIHATESTVAESSSDISTKIGLRIFWGQLSSHALSKSLSWKYKTKTVIHAIAHDI